MKSDSPNLPAIDRAWKEENEIERDVIKLIAMDIGKATAEHIEHMYPQAVTATGSSFLTSVRNTVYNEIMAALQTTDENEIRERIRLRKADRTRLRKLWKANREPE